MAINFEQNRLTCGASMLGVIRRTAIEQCQGEPNAAMLIALLSDSP